MKTILCIDIGTTSLKAALISDKKTVEAYSREDLGTNENHDIAEKWITALKSAVKKMKSEVSTATIEAVCVSGNGPTVVIENGKLKNENSHESFTLLWNDCDFNEINHQDYKTSSLYIPRFQILKENFSEIWNNARKFFSGPEYLIYRLTASEVSILPEERFIQAYWSLEEMKKCGFSNNDFEKLPKFVKMGSLAGKITEDFEIFGIPKDIPVFCGAPDFVVALIGTGTVKAGRCCDRAGSSEGINLCTTKPIFGDGIRTLPSAISGLWNASVLISESGTRRLKNGKLTTKNDEALLKEFSEAIDRLRKCAKESGESFPTKIQVTGGQCKDKTWIQKKSQVADIELEVQWCDDAELIGDFILAKIGLGDYKNFEEACEQLR